MKEVIFIINESLDGGYEAESVGFPIFTEGESYDEVKFNIREAVKCHFEEEEMPQIIRLHLVKDEVLAL